MAPLWILFVGVAIVIGGVLFLRLHAFLALTLGALAVGALTSREAMERYEVSKSGWQIAAVEELGVAQYRFQFLMQGRKLEPGASVLVFAGESETWSRRGRAQVEAAGGSALGAIAGQNNLDDVAIALISEEVKVGDVVATETAAAAAAKLGGMTVGERVATAFGTMCGKIGILIAMAAIIGKCLLDSGAADRIVRSALGVVGERGAPFAFVGSGFVLGIPVFFDTVFYLMIPLGKAMTMRTKRNYLLYILTIVAGGTMAHSLVPPTPGPLMVAEELGVDIGLMIVMGAVVGLVASGAAMAYAYWRSANNEVPLRESPEFSLSELEGLTQQDPADLPPLFISLAPILLPVLLIAGYTVLKSMSVESEWVMSAAATLGNKNIALAVAAVIAMATLAWKKQLRFRELADRVGPALASGGIIILITAAGGAFGAMMQQTGVASLIRDLPDVSTTLVLVLAFLVTTAIRTAQGSATVAMITAVGVLSAFATDGAIACHPVYLALAIGCGSKPIAWMNDSGFWVICKMSGMTEEEGLRYLTPMSILMGIVGLAVTLVLANVVPLA